MLDEFVYDAPEVVDLQPHRRDAEHAGAALKRPRIERELDPLRRGPRVGAEPADLRVSRIAHDRIVNPTVVMRQPRAAAMCW